MFKLADKITELDKDLYNEFKLEEQINNKIISEYTEKINSFIETQVREHSTPPIKGEITKGKIKWRGITQQTFILPNGAREIVIMQRGKQIGGSLKIDFNYDLNR